jgi:hypothetical protein
VPSQQLLHRAVQQQQGLLLRRQYMCMHARRSACMLWLLQFLTDWCLNPCPAAAVHVLRTATTSHALPPSVL